MKYWPQGQPRAHKEAKHLGLPGRPGSRGRPGTCVRACQAGASSVLQRPHRRPPAHRHPSQTQHPPRCALQGPLSAAGEGAAGQGGSPVRVSLGSGTAPGGPCGTSALSAAGCGGRELQQGRSAGLLDSHMQSSGALQGDACRGSNPSLPLVAEAAVAPLDSSGLSPLSATARRAAGHRG